MNLSAQIELSASIRRLSGMGSHKSRVGMQCVYIAWFDPGAQVENHVWPVS
jgi:hypothetical protein